MPVYQIYCLTNHFPKPVNSFLLYLSGNQRPMRYYFLGVFTLFCLLSYGQETPSRPNILFSISDDQSFPHASAYGTDWINTPGFDRVAREGILFMNAYTPNAK